MLGHFAGLPLTLIPLSHPCSQLCPQGIRVASYTPWGEPSCFWLGGGSSLSGAPADRGGGTALAPPILNPEAPRTRVGLLGRRGSACARAGSASSGVGLGGTAGLLGLPQLSGSCELPVLRLWWHPGDGGGLAFPLGAPVCPFPQTGLGPQAWMLGLSRLRLPCFLASASIRDRHWPSFQPCCPPPWACMPAFR